MLGKPFMPCSLIAGLISLVVFTGCEQSSSITLSCDPQVKPGEQANLNITKESKGFAIDNKNGDGDFEYNLFAVEEGNTVVEMLIDTSHNFCMSTNTNVKIGLSQKSTYKYPIHTKLVNSDTSLFYIDCFKPIYRVISSGNKVALKLVVTNHKLGTIKDTVGIEIVR